MAIPMVNIVEFAHVLDLLDQFASTTIVDRALCAEGLSRKVFEQGAGFIPYRMEASVVEHVARTRGDSQLGARLSAQFDYATYDAYARYVLGAKDLATAISRGRRAYFLLHRGSEIVLRRHGSHIIVGRRSELNTVIGHEHLDDGAILLIGRVLQHFLGSDWRPSWVECTHDSTGGSSYLEDQLRAPVRTGAKMPALAVRVSDLSTPNPKPISPHQIVSFMELPALMGVEPSETMSDAVMQILRAQFVIGDLSEESVASRLSIGRRTLQRTLKAEATSFREVKARFIEARARTLLAESNLDLVSIACALGYDEPNSFRRAFRAWTGLTPKAYRALATKSAQARSTETQP